MLERIKTVLIAATILATFLITGCSDSPIGSPSPIPLDSNAKVVFLELGSENCIPCKNMRPVMDSIQKKYGHQILVKYIDVLKNPKEAAPYKIEAMPTQVFLDSNRKEIRRHLGFYPEDSIHVFLKSIGLKILGE